MTPQDRRKLRWYYRVGERFLQSRQSYVVVKHLRSLAVSEVHCINDGRAYRMDESDGVILPLSQRTTKKAMAVETGLRGTPSSTVSVVRDRELPREHRLERVRALLRDELREPGITRENCFIYGLVLETLTNHMDQLRVRHDTEKSRQ